MKRLVVTGIVVLGLSGCTNVALKSQGQSVDIGYSGNIQHCRYVGTVQATTLAKMLVNRDTAAVQEELYTLARNEAGKMGATNLVQHGRPEAGVQTFSAYDCPQIS